MGLTGEHVVGHGGEELEPIYHGTNEVVVLLDLGQDLSSNATSAHALDQCTCTQPLTAVHLHLTSAPAPFTSHSQPVHLH